MYYAGLGAAPRAAAVPAFAPVPAFVLVPPISDQTKKLVVFGGLALVGVALLVYIRARKGATP